MPAERTRHGTTRYRDRRSNDPAYDTLISDTLTKIVTNEYSSFREAAKCTGVSEIMKTL